MSEKFNIRLNIAGRPFSLAIERHKEEYYRRAEREVNTLVTMYKSRFKASDEDYLAMTATHFAVMAVELQMSRSLGEDIDELVEIDKELDGYLNGLKKEI